ncbi:MAG TPA: methyltransferase domain-containing protein [Isosphaeraceae bacterium]|jgi:SAM-dependent methyltransferase|nr:methyltransferase domain-containing protein [Isosphaeraceae bacterium]
MAGAGVPEYATTLAAYHAAFAAELRAMVESLPIAEGDHVLDMACGDGTYVGWLAGRVGPDGLVVGVDAAPSYLDLAREAPRPDDVLDRLGFVAATLERLPFEGGTFDLAWCAQSLFSLPEPVGAVQALARVVRPGGVVAVLEDDTLHQVLLPWPVELELAVRQAELLGFAEESKRPRKFYVGRRLRGVFEAAGLVDCRRRTWAADRQAPLGPAERAYFASYLTDLRDRAAPHLEPATLEALDRLLDPDGDDPLLDRPDLMVTTISHVMLGRRPGDDPPRRAGTTRRAAAPR